MLKELLTLLKYASIFTVANIIYVLNFGFMLTPSVISNGILFCLVILIFNASPWTQLGNVMKLKYSEIKDINIIRYITIRNLGFTNLCFGTIITTICLTTKIKEFILPESERNLFEGVSLELQALITILGFILIAIGLVTFIALYFKVEKKITKGEKERTLCEIEEIKKKCAFLVDSIKKKGKEIQKEKSQKSEKRQNPKQDQIDAIADKRKKRKKRIADCLKQKEQSFIFMSQDEALARFS